MRRRFVPPQEKFALLQEHTVTEGERLDHIAAKYLGDPGNSGACATPTARFGLTNCLSQSAAGFASPCRKTFPERKMDSGFHLTLMIGPVVPVAVPAGSAGRVRLL